ncbi:hypothetical protein OG21DRAFT_1426338, partial [Imleria badia]
YFSRLTPCLANVIPAMDLIDEKLTTYSLDHNYTPSICAAVSLAQHMLNKYYQLTDSSHTYRIAMILHPCHKFNYFLKVKWELEWINTA